MVRTLRRLRMFTALGAAAGTLLLTSAAHAQAQAGHDFGEQGQFIFSADRLFPFFSFTSNSESANGTTLTQQGTAISFFWGANQNLLGDGIGTVYSVPRVGFDYTIIPHLTIGGDLIAFFTLGGSSTTSTNNVSASSGNASGNIFGIAPRVGYILGMSDVISFWLRGGLSYYNANESSNANCATGSGSNSKNINVGGIDLDPQVVISPIPHFAFTAGPALDWGFAGGLSTTTQQNQQCNSTTTNSEGYNSVNFSINGGLLGWF